MKKARTYFRAAVMADKVAKYWQDLIFERYGERWVITYDRHFRWQVVDQTNPLLFDHQGFFNDFLLMEQHIKKVFPDLRGKFYQEPAKRQVNTDNAKSEPQTNVVVGGRTGGH